jgi:Cu/Ag efflux protein CusF
MAGAVLTPPLAAQTGGDHASRHPDPGATAPPALVTEGEVRKVDRGAGKVTIKHGALPNLDMPPMTMVFRVKDPAMLDQLKEGDRIRFTAEKIDGALTVTHVELSK